MNLGATVLKPVFDFFVRFANKGFVILSIFCFTEAFIVLDSISYYITLCTPPLVDLEVFAVVADAPRFVLDKNIDELRLISLASLRLLKLAYPNRPG